MPAVIVFVGIVLIPTVILVYSSLSDWSLVSAGHTSFIGLRNYAQVFSDSRFVKSLTVTVLFLTGAVTLEVLVGFFLAIFLQRAPTLIRTIILIPSMIAPVVVGLLWRIILNFHGPLNSVLGIFGIEGLAYLTSPNVVLLSVIFVDVWQWAPFMMIILFAGIQSVAIDMLDAARVDGASSFSTYWHVIIPTILPVALIAISIRFIDAVKTFDTVFLLTGGGPGYFTEILSMYAYEKGIVYGNIAYASAIAFMILLVNVNVSRFVLAKRLLR